MKKQVYKYMLPKLLGFKDISKTSRSYIGLLFVLVFDKRNTEKIIYSNFIKDRLNYMEET